MLRVNTLLIACFLLSLWAPCALRRMQPVTWKAVALENRLPASLPDWPQSPRAVQAFPSAFEAWHADTFGGRDFLVREHNSQSLLALGAAPNDRLCVGREGWLFFTGDDSVRAWRGVLQLSAAHIADWSAQIEARAAYFATQGIEYRLVIAPNKESIYREYLPEHEAQLGPTPLDQLLAGLSPQARAAVLDLRPALLEEKAQDRAELGDYVYNPLGTHWTERGAWRAAQAIDARVPGPESWSLERELEDPGDSWAINLGLTQSLCQAVWRCVLRDPRATRTSAIDRHLYLTREAHYVQPTSALPRTLLVSDSFGPHVHSFLAEACSELHFRWRLSFPMEALLEAPPMRVVELYSERRVLTPLSPLQLGLIQLGEEEWSSLAPLSAPSARAHPLAAFAAGVLSSTPGRDKLYLDLPKVESSGRVALRIVCDAPSATLGFLWYRFAQQADYSQKQRYPLPLQAGRNVLCFELDHPELAPTLLWMMGQAPGDYALRSIEARQRR